MKSFENNIVLLGFGAVGTSVLNILEREVNFDKSKLTIIDKKPCPYPLEYKYIQAELFPSHQEELFSQFLSKGDLLLDFTSETDCLETIKWCHQKGIMYLNTGDNEWPDNEWKNICDHSMANNEFFKTCNSDDTTIIIHHGANPGSVSHFMKKALHDIVTDLLVDNKTDLDKNKLSHLLKQNRWAELAEYLEVRTIQSNDIDTQIVDDKYINDDTFYSTWNPPTFFNESICQAEARVGTHEEFELSADVHKYFPNNGAVEFKHRGTQYYSRSWSPVGEFEGMIIGHEEVFSIADKYSTHNEDGSLRYAPTVYFSYQASKAAMQSLIKAAQNNYQEPEKYQLIKEGIVSGTEYVGVLVMGDKFKTRWVGNCITLERINQLFPNQTPTILQVSISAVAAISYMLEHRNIGVNYPDDLPYEPILATIEKYAGETISMATDFTLSNQMSQDLQVKNDQELNILLK